jgi:predicted molibdopterin-dependent oxidoreductase YjgC
VDTDFGRLTQPLVRTNGKLQATTWDAALGLVANRFTDLKSRYGPDTFGCYSCSKTTNELNFLAQKFTRAVIGTNNVDSCNRT